jgi:Flp pilus assembly protein TadG
MKHQARQPQKPRPRHKRGQRGQTLIIVAFLSVFLIALLGLVIDSVRLYILTAQAERAAEAAALAGALYMPDYYDTPAPAPDNQDAVMRVCAIGLQNGITNCPAAPGTVGMTPSIVAGNIYELQVTVTLQADVFFLNLVSPSLANATVTRTATAQFLPPIALGSRSSEFGDNATQSFYARLNGPSSLKGNGDAFTPIWEEGPTDPIAYPDASSSIYPFSRWGGTVCCTNQQQWPTPITNPDQHPAGFTGASGVLGYNYEIIVPPGAGNVTVQIYNPAFVPVQANGAVGVDDMGNACSDPAFNTGGCKTDQKNEYLQMSYSLYQSPLLFERGTDSLVASTSYPSLDAISGDNTARGCNGGTPYWDPQQQKCMPDPGYVRKWSDFFTITQPGTYRLAVEATGYYGEHEYGIRLNGSGGVAPRIWAWNDMCVYFTVAGGGDTIFDLGEIPAAYAGKTLNFSLFDPGDGGGTINMSILDPSGNAVALPAWVKTTPASSGTVIDATGGTYNGQWLHLPITIPTTYNPTPGNDWWQIKYSTGTGATPNDTITISISLSGSPIHLVSEIA